MAREPPTFFLPEAKSPEQAEEVYAGIGKFAEETTGWKILPRRIWRIEYVHNGRNYAAEVGVDFPPLREPVIAILEATQTYLVCTQNRGVVRGMPVLVGKNEARRVEDFTTG